MPPYFHLTAIVEYMKRRSDPNYQPPPSDVIELVAEDFDEKVKASPLMLVKFYSPTNAASQQVYILIIKIRNLCCLPI
jgi:hypothetical protein